MITGIIIGCILVLFIMIIVLRAILFKPLEGEEVKINEIAFTDDEKEWIINSLAEMIKCKTVSHIDSEKDDKKEFDKFEKLLQINFPSVYAKSEFIKLGEKSLLFFIKGSSANPKNIVLMAHYDVVPADEKNWSKPAFSGHKENDVLWGRGTLDTKGTLNGVMCSMEKLLKSGFIPKHNFYLAFGGDEEINGIGAPTIVDYFEKNNIKIDMVLDEGGAVVENVFPKVNKKCAVIGIAEKGMLNVKLAVKSQGGHASTPKPNGSIAKLAKAVIKIEKSPFKQVLTIPTLELFNKLGRHSSFVYRLIFANLWLFKGVLNMICKKGGGEMNAISRTTTAFTQMEGSPAINVMPSEASICINLRLISGETQESALAYLKKIIDDEAVEITRISGFNPTSISEIECKQFNIIEKSVMQTWENTIATPYLMLACSDARNYDNISKNVYRFCPMHLSKEERASIHGNDEKIPFPTIIKVVEFYINLIQNCQEI